MELFSAEISRVLSFGPFIFNGSRSDIGDRDLPLRICFFYDADDEVYGDRICNNAIASAIVSILVATVLLVLDLQLPCLNSMVGTL